MHAYVWIGFCDGLGLFPLRRLANWYYPWMRKSPKRPYHLSCRRMFEVNRTKTMKNTFDN